MPSESDHPPSTISTRGCDSNGDASSVAALTRALIADDLPRPKRPSRVPRFPIGKATNEFRKRCFPAATVQDWNDWRWQTRNRIRTLEALERILQLSDDERSAIERHTGSLPVGITP